MNDSHALSRPPWLAVHGAVADAPPAGSGAPALPETPARRLLREHLRHGSGARREAAAFALALTQPAAAEAIEAFFTARRQGRKRDE